MINILAVDPGDKNIGVCYMWSTGSIIDNKILDKEEFFRYLDDEEPRVYVIEDFRLWKGRTKQGNTLGASEIIGAVEFQAHRRNVPIVRQSPQILIPTAMHAEVALPKGHIPDDMSAYLHGFRYLVDKGMLLPIAQRGTL